MRNLSRTWFVAFLVLIPLAGTLHAADQGVEIQSALKTMNDLRVAETDVIGAFINSAMQLEALLAKQPDIEGLQASTKNLVQAYEAYNTAAAAVRMLLQATKGIAWEGRDDLADDVASKSVNELKVLTDAMQKLNSTMVKSSFTTYASEGWENSGLNVTAGDLIYIQPEGSWTVSRNGWPATDWRGYSDQQNSAYAINGEAPLGALLFRVRGSTNQKGAGFNEFGKGNADASGRLEFVINDSDRGNNHGQLTLTIYHFNADAIVDVINGLQTLTAPENKNE